MPPWARTAASQALNPASAPRYFAALASARHSSEASNSAAALYEREFSRAQFRPTLRQRMRHALILTDRPTKHDTFARILSGAFKRCKAKSNRLDSKQNALRIQALDQVFEPPAPPRR